MSEDVKAGATSLGSPNREAQVLLINAVKDVASALSDLMLSTKAATGKDIHDPAMKHLKESAKVSSKHGIILKGNKIISNRKLNLFDQKFEDTLFGCNPQRRQILSTSEDLHNSESEFSNISDCFDVNQFVSGMNLMSIVEVSSR